MVLGGNNEEIRNIWKNYASSFVGCFNWSYGCKRERTEGAAASIGRTSKLYYKYKKNNDQKEEELQELKEKREIERNTKVSLTLCIDQMESELYSEIKPLFEDYGWKGTFVIQNGALPGSENSITKTQYNELLDDGWDVAIGNWDDLDLNREEDRQIWIERLDELIKKMETEKLSIPKSYYFERNAYAEECEEF